MFWCICTSCLFCKTKAQHVQNKSTARVEGIHSARVLTSTACKNRRQEFDRKRKDLVLVC